MQFTTRDKLMFDILTTKVRALSLNQIAIEFFGGDFANANRRLRQLVATKVIARQRLIARQLPQPTEPCFVWTPATPPPSFEVVARMVKRRWSRLPTRMTAVYFAEARFSSIVGNRAKGRLMHPLQISHDLGLASIYLHFLHKHPQRASQWLGEDSFESRNQRKKQTPDAVIIDGNFRPALAIEFGGIYTADRIERFHRHCSARSLPYEIW
ncbi:MAG: hypothetical protein SFV81_07025 [Pirellulaceae bacterium]|nr:hypothetical protein [Pirellulaceae bacterium]